MARIRSVKYRLEQWLWSLGTLVIALFPTWIWLLCYKIIGPTGFIEKFLVFGAGIWIGGGFQVVLLLGWFAFIFSVVLE
jgi:hypothetical protein